MTRIFRITMYQWIYQWSTQKYISQFFSSLNFKKNYRRRFLKHFVNEIAIIFDQMKLILRNRKRKMSTRQLYIGILLNCNISYISYIKFFSHSHTDIYLYFLDPLSFSSFSLLSFIHCHSHSHLIFFQLAINHLIIFYSDMDNILHSYRIRKEQIEI